MAKDSNAVWQTIDVDTLPAQARKAYDAYKVAQRAAAQLRADFEAIMNDPAAVPAGSKLVFGYRFGQLSAALVADDSKPKVAKGAASLADFLKAQQAAGART